MGKLRPLLLLFGPGLNTTPSEMEGPAGYSLLCNGVGGVGGASPLEDAAGALLRPRRLGTQDGPDGFVEDSFQASLGEGRALQVFHRIWVRPREGRGPGQGRIPGKTPSQDTCLPQAGGHRGCAAQSRALASLCRLLMPGTGSLSSVGG